MKSCRPLVILILLATISICLAPQPETLLPNAQVLVACHSLTGNTKAMAEGVVEGVQKMKRASAP